MLLCSFQSSHSLRQKMIYAFKRFTSKMSVLAAHLKQHIYNQMVFKSYRWIITSSMQAWFSHTFKIMSILNHKLFLLRLSSRTTSSTDGVLLMSPVILSILLFHYWFSPTELALHLVGNGWKVCCSVSDLALIEPCCNGHIPTFFIYTLSLHWKF